MGSYEECHSSESGWTMYIGSPEHDDDDGGSTSKSIGEDNRDNVKYSNGFSYSKKGGDEDEESDDSMASDASSGPSYYHEMNAPRHAGECSPGYNKALRELKEEVPKMRCGERRRPAKEETDRSDTGSKARKNLKFQTGKGKK